MKLDINLIDPDPENVRKGADRDLEGLMASIAALGQLQAIGVRKAGDRYIATYGNRRLLAMKAMGAPVIDAEIVAFETEAHAIAAQAAENMVRRDLRPVEQWRAMRRLVDAGASLASAAATLGIDERAAKRLDVLGRLAGPILDHIEATDDMPHQGQMRAIALRSVKDQEAAWKKNKPRKDQPADWHGIAQALEIRSIARRHALFGDDLAKAHGVGWQTDWLAPPADAEHTTQVPGFLAAQAQHLTDVEIPRLAAAGVRACIVATDEYGHMKLPKGCEMHAYNPSPSDWLKVKKGLVLGFYVDRDGRVRANSYSEPKPVVKKAAAAKPGVTGAADEPAEGEMLTKDGLALVERRKREAAAEAVQADYCVTTLLRAMVALTAHLGNDDGLTARHMLLQEDGGLAIEGDAEATAHQAVAMIRYLLVSRADRIPLPLVERIGLGFKGRATFPLVEIDKVKKAGLVEMASNLGVDARAYKTQKELRAAIVQACHDLGDPGGAVLPAMAWAPPLPGAPLPGDKGREDIDDLGEPEDADADLRAVA